MTTTLLKQNISKVINSIEDKIFLEAVYIIVSKKVIEIPFESGESLNYELDKRRQNPKKSISKSYSWQLVKKTSSKP